MYVKYFYAFPFAEQLKFDVNVSKKYHIWFYLLLFIIVHYTISLFFLLNADTFQLYIHSEKKYITQQNVWWTFILSFEFVYSVGNLWPDEKVIHLIMILLRNIILCWALSCELCFGRKILFIELLHTFLFLWITSKIFFKVVIRLFWANSFSIFSKICILK